MFFISSYLSVIGLTLFGCDVKIKESNQDVVYIEKLIDDWHLAAAESDYQKYFDFFAEESYFLGTDAKENWDLEAFKQYAKPHFDRLKGWKFKSLERHIYFSKDSKVVWFDELLQTSMKLCRGSGVLVKKDQGNWRLKHYVLSATVPNENVRDLIEIKSPIETKLIDSLSKVRKLSHY